MNVFSLRTLIDDILLIVRNNNISESEDLSRDQIRAWILAYKAYLTKKKHDKDKETGEVILRDHKTSSFKYLKNGSVSKTNQEHFTAFKINCPCRQNNSRGISFYLF